MAKRRKFIQEVGRTFGIVNPIAESIEGSVFRMSIDSITKLKSQLYTLLFTNKGERVMMPTYGTNIQSRMFEPMTGLVYEDIRQDIMKAVKEWIPELQVNAVVFEDKEENEENSLLIITIEYSHIADSKMQDQVQIEMSV